MNQISLEVNSREKSSLPIQEKLLSSYKRIRAFTEYLCEPLAIEDYIIQSMTDASPTKWHLAHTSWFFESFVLSQAIPDYQPFHPQYAYLFNSYYIGMGNRHDRPRRGMLSRPTVHEIYEYRHSIDERIQNWMHQASAHEWDRWGPVIEIGLNHEQQHQELLLTDFKHMISQNPLYPVYRPRELAPSADIPSMKWIEISEGVYDIGYGGDDFFYDNEGPRHRQYIPEIRMASRLVTNEEYLQFMESGGYRQHQHWLSEGWEIVQRENWQSPLYWQRKDDQWFQYTLSGHREVNPTEPVTHISYFEADAYARWAGARLPSEFEWEAAGTALPIVGNFIEEKIYHPIPLSNDENSQALQQMFGDAWEWTQSAYSPYPGYHASNDALGEYNGKWMCNQYVLRGGSCATSISHIRTTYRNFFPTYARWQFTGIRLVKN